MNKLKRMLSTREAKKLLRNKSAMLALFVIATYLLTALFVMCGGISRDTCDTVMGPNKLPGFFRPATP